jgi:hypothetical protein
MTTCVPSCRGSVRYAALTIGLIDTFTLFLSLLVKGPPLARASEAFTMDPISAFMLEIKKHGGWFMSQYMWRLSHVMMLKVSLTYGLRPIPSISTKLWCARWCWRGPWIQGVRLTSPIETTGTNQLKEAVKSPSACQSGLESKDRNWAVPCYGSGGVNWNLPTCAESSVVLMSCCGLTDSAPCHFPFFLKRRRRADCNTFVARNSDTTEARFGWRAD